MKTRNQLRIVVFVLFLAGCYYWGTASGSHSGPYFAVVPHFMRQSSVVREFYTVLQQKYGPIETIIVISPDHFEETIAPVEQGCSTQQKTPAAVCYKTTCIPLADALPAVPCSNRWFTAVSSGYSVSDHGIGEQLRRIAAVRPAARVVPLLVQPRKVYSAFQNLEHLTLSDRTLVIASVDFSHYVGESFARVHDATTVSVLRFADTVADFMNIEADCPACLFIITTFAKQYDRLPVVWKRDSSSRAMSAFYDSGATSRQFIRYGESQEVVDTNTITVGFFGDLIYDRGVREALPSPEDVSLMRSGLYQQRLPHLNPAHMVHRPLFGIDMVGFSLEGALIDSAQMACDDAELTLCSDSAIVPVLREVGFSIASIASNHTRDRGEAGITETVDYLRDYGIAPIGTIMSGARTVAAYTATGVIRGISYAWHGFDFTTTKNMLDVACTQLQVSTETLNMVSVHRGNEYQSQHDAVQEHIAHRLVTCGADAIIGHHPHVPQDIERYRGVPIIYSVGNFLFDQTQACNGMYVLLTIPFDPTGDQGTIDVLTGAVRSCP